MGAQRRAYADAKARASRLGAPRARLLFGSLNVQGAGADFDLTRGATALKVEIKAAESWRALVDGTRRYSWGGHGVDGHPVHISRQLSTAGAHVLLLSFLRPDHAPVAAGPALQEVHWYIVVDLRSLTRAQWTFLRKKHLNASSLKVERALGVKATQDLKTAFAGLF